MSLAESEQRVLPARDERHTRDTHRLGPLALLPPTRRSQRSEEPALARAGGADQPAQVTGVG